MIDNEFAHQSYGINGNNEKEVVAHIEKTTTRTRMEAPELVRAMSPEQRAHAEKKLVRKIDFRLMPMLILMYIMNYLDRNNVSHQISSHLHKC